MSLQTINTVDWNPTGDQIVTGHRGLIAFWDAASGELVRTVAVMNPSLPSEPLGVSAIAWNPDDTKLAVGATSMNPLGIILIMDAETGEMLGTLDSQNGVPDLDWSPEGKLLAAAAPELFGDPGEDALIVWDTETYIEAGRINGDVLEGISTVDWHPIENWIATGGGEDTNAYVWEASTGELLTTLSGYQDIVNVVAWSPDGRSIATGSQDGTLALWVSGTGQLLNSYNLSEDSVRDIDWQPNGEKLAYVGVETAYIIDMTNGEQITALDGNGVVAWSPDGSGLAVLQTNGAEDDQVAIYDDAGNLVAMIVPAQAELPDAK